VKIQGEKRAGELLRLPQIKLISVRSAAEPEQGKGGDLFLRKASEGAWVQITREELHTWGSSVLAGWSGVIWEKNR